ncbi:nucleotidyltransferase domain-containing protein [Paenibacillus cremeus]|uniref:nucleotidyltransferase domain-containing protein n=1 Tax=Paenibacillus cremeus TaxID=2163881 RepID=UPI0021BD0C7E|nr:nucleotidyltransferase domain-containing protein [Paenibacillus cremeus]
MSVRLAPIDAAIRFVEEYFPACEAALLAGSSIQGRATATSDLDLVLFDESQPGPFRQTFVAYDWVIEAFVLTRATYRYFFDEGIDSAIPSLQRMCAEGQLLRGGELVSDIVEEARAELLAGPPTWSREEVNKGRYEIGEALEDLTGCDQREEGLFIVHKLAGLLAEFKLRTSGCWLGDGKWLHRCLQRCDAVWSAQLTEALEAYYRRDDAAPLGLLSAQLLAPFGGFLVHGYAEGTGVFDAAEGEAAEGFGDASAAALGLGGLLGEARGDA